MGGIAIVWEDLISAMQYVPSLSGHLSPLSIQQQMVTNMPQYLQLPCIHLFGLMDAGVVRQILAS